jgi:chromosome segregation ATPase
MRKLQLLALISVATLLSAAPSSVFAQQNQTSTGDPIADAARKAREQKKTAPKARKVFTDEDVAQKPNAEIPPPSSTLNTSDTVGSSESKTGTAAESKESSSSDPEKKDTNPETAWRKRFAAQHKKIADAQQELEVLQREAEKADVQYYSDPQKALKEQYSREEINSKNEKIATKKKEIAALQQQLSDLEDELRRSGGDPGWAR